MDTKQNKVKLLLVDDHAIIRDGIAAMLSDPDIEIIGTASSGEEAVNKARELSPDIIIMDIVLKGMTGIEATRWIKEHNPNVKVIVLSSEVKKEFLSAGIQAGISGYLHKDVGREGLIDAIRAVHRGEKSFNEAITNVVFEDFYSKAKVAIPASISLTEDLTKREVEVLALVAKGLSNKEVAEHLFISVKTVETHKTHILEKLGLRNTAELVKYAIKNKIVPLE